MANMAENHLGTPTQIKKNLMKGKVLVLEVAYCWFQDTDTV